MRSRTLAPPTTASPARWPVAVWQRLRDSYARHVARRQLARAERALAEMSYRGLRDIGAPEALLQRRRQQDASQREEQRLWTHLRG